MDPGRWQARLDRLAAAHGVPGASLAVLAGGTVSTAATGVLNRATGVESTPDSLFQLGSISKVYTATVLMRLIESGPVTVDTPVATVLPELRSAGGVTLAHLLTHTSGLDDDVPVDTGRGDDCLARYAAACADLRPAYPPGSTLSYCNLGFSLLGRVVEVLAGTTWDEALATLLLAPLGVTHTHTLPEEVLRFRAALGHLTDEDGQLRPADRWGLWRNAGPAGTVTATAADVLALARLHLSGGLAPDGTRLLAADTVAAMRSPRVTVPAPWGSGDHWGLGWAVFDWAGRRGYGHDGATIGQLARLRVVPDAGVAVAVLANGDRAGELLTELTAEVLRAVAGLELPPPFGPPDRPAAVEPAVLARLAGIYQRSSVRFEAVPRAGGLVLLRTEVDELSGRRDESEVVLTPVTDSLYAGRSPHTSAWQPYCFGRLPDGRGCLYVQGRATPRRR